MYKSIQKFSCWLFVCLLITGISFQVSAQVPQYIKVLHEKITLAEFSMLPDFLQDRILGGHGEYRLRAAESKEWKKKIGPDYIHYHHWVLAIVMFQRGIVQTDEYKRKYLFKRSIGEYSYVIKRVKKNNPHRYRLHYSRGLAFMNLGKYEAAMKDFMISNKLKK